MYCRTISDGSVKRTLEDFARFYKESFKYSVNKITKNTDGGKNVYTLQYIIS